MKKSDFNAITASVVTHKANVPNMSINGSEFVKREDCQIIIDKVRRKMLMEYVQYKNDMLNKLDFEEQNRLSPLFQSFETFLILKLTVK